MEFVIALIVIVVLCKILGISNVMLIAAALGIIELFVIAMLFLFAGLLIMLIFSKPHKAEFVREGTTGRSKFGVAFYLVGDREIPCIFPIESGMKSRLYIPGRKYFVMYNKRLDRVFDKWTVATCLLGFVFSSAVVAVTAQVIIMIMR